MSTTLILNAKIVNEGDITEADVLIKNGRFEKIANDLSGQNADTTIDANGMTLLPGMIDSQVHFREPGLTHKADMATESRAAVAGGITSFMDMPNTIPNTLTSEILEEKYNLASQKSLANYSFYFGAANNNLEDIKRLDPKAACGIKVFMGASTGNMLVDDPAVLEGIFRDAPTLIATHCEDTPTILANEAKMREQYGDNIPIELHPEIRSREACIKSSQLALELARVFDSRLHILHITTAEEALGFDAGPVTDKKITAEACVHFLHFSDEDYAEKGALIKCNPAIKTAADKAAIIQALQENRLDLIATDHAPHSWEEKQGNYFQAPSGLPLVQHALLVVLEHYHDGEFTLPFIAHKTSHAVAECFKIHERGYIREGYWADLVLIDLNQTTLASHDTALSKCGWTPFDGYRFHSRIHSTMVSGELVFHDGNFVSSQLGHRLQFDR